MKRDRILSGRNSAKNETCVRRASLTEDQLDALARAYGSRLIRQPAAPDGPSERGTPHEEKPR